MTTPDPETPASSQPRGSRASSFGWWMDAVAIALFAAVVAGLMLLSVRSPLHADDFSGLVATRGQSFLTNVTSGYTDWFGRLSPMVLGQIALRYPLLWGIVNGVAMVALVVLTFAVAMGRWPRKARRDLQLLAVVLAAYWFALPAIGETVFWRSGAPVYLWPTWLLLLFVFPYRRWMSSALRGPGRGPVLRVAAALGWFALGFVVGCSQEQVVVALIVLLAVFAARVWRRGLRAAPAALVAGVVGAALGAAVLVLAPGNENRLAETGALSLTMLERASGFAAYLASIILCWLPPLIPWLLCLLVAAVPLGKTGPKQASAPDGASRAWLVWGLVSVATLAPFVLTPGLNAERTSMFLAVFLTISVLSLSGDTVRSALDLLPPATTSAIIAVLMLFVLASITVTARGQMLLDGVLQQREQSIAAQKARGVEDVVVPPISIEIRRGYRYRAISFFDLTTEPSHPINLSQADWYGVRTIATGGEGTHITYGSGGP